MIPIAVYGLGTVPGPTALLLKTSVLQQSVCVARLRIFNSDRFAWVFVRESCEKRLLRVSRFNRLHLPRTTVYRILNDIESALF